MSNTSVQVCSQCKTRVIPTNGICPSCRQPFQAASENESHQPDPQRRQHRSQFSDNLTVIDWIVVVSFPVAGLIVGLLRLCVGTPSANKMFFYSMCTMAVWIGIRLACLFLFP